MNPDGLYVISERPGRICLVPIEGPPYAAVAGSREEMDLKLASMGLEAGWEDDLGTACGETFYEVWRIPG